MANTDLTSEHVLASMSGVLLVRYGPPCMPESLYSVIETDHVAGFSYLSYLRPVQAATLYFLDHALAAIRRKELPLCCGK